MRTIVVLASALVLFPSVAAWPTVDTSDYGLPVGVSVRPGDIIDAAPSANVTWVTVNITTDLSGTASGDLTINGTAEASAGYQVASVDVRVDDRPFGHANGTENWTFELDTTLLLDGAHKLSAVAYASPIVLPVGVYSSTMTDAVLNTSNHEAGVVLFDQNATFTGSQTGTWTFSLDKDYRDVRLLLTSAGDATTQPRGEVLMTYKGANSSSPERTWLASYGQAQGSQLVERDADGTLHAPGIVMLQAAFAGDGALRIRVEGVPIAG